MDRRWWPSSRLLTFDSESREALFRCYLHTSHYSRQGWYEPAEYRIPLRHDFGAMT